MLSQPGLNFVMLVTSDALEEIDRRDGLEGSDGEAKRRRVHFMRYALAHGGKSGRRVVSAFIATAFA